jgi:hypothetical protein
MNAAPKGLDAHGRTRGGGLAASAVDGEGEGPDASAAFPGRITFPPERLANR